MGLLYFIVIWVALIAIAGIAYMGFKALAKASSGLRVKMPKMPKWGDSDLSNKWSALTTKEKVIVIIIILLPMAGAFTYYHIKQQKRTQ